MDVHPISITFTLVSALSGQNTVIGVEILDQQLPVNSKNFF